MSVDRTGPSPETTLRALVRITKVIGEGRSLEAVFDAVADELASLLPFDRCSVALVDTDGEMVNVSTHRGRIGERFAEGRLPLAGSVAAWVVEHCRPLFHDVGPVDRFAADDDRRRLGIAQVVAVPLVVDGAAVGAFGLSSVVAGTYRPADLPLLETVADHLALAIAATNLRRDAEARAARAQFLAGTAAAFAATLDLDRTLREAVNHAADVLGDLNAIFLVDEADGALRLREVSHPEPALEELVRRLEREHPPTTDSPILGPPLRGEALLIPKLTPDRISPELREVVARAGVRSIVAAPLIAGGRVTGALCSWWTGWLSGEASRRREAGPDDLALARDLAAQIAGAVEQARLYAAAQRAIAVRDDFLAVAAHELRTPLTTLRGRTQLLERRLDTLLGPPDRASFRVVLHQIDRIGRMIDDLLDFSRSDQAALPLAPAASDLVALVHDAVATQDDPDDRIAVVADEASLVGAWDARRLEQVLANLLGNALRFSAPDTPVTVRVCRDGDEAIVSIEDRGAGIAADELERIFERFYRSDRTERSGFGIGLALSRRIVEEHGGRLWAESAGPGHGATLTMALPLTKAQDAGREARSKGQGASGASARDRPS